MALIFVLTMHGTVSKVAISAELYIIIMRERERERQRQRQRQRQRDREREYLDLDVLSLTREMNKHYFTWVVEQTQALSTSIPCP